MRLQKWQALGNDYLIVEQARLPWPMTAGRVRRLCDPHLGLGADGVLVLEPAADARFVAALRIFNPDGSEAELSGNGVREAVLYLRREGWTDRDSFSILTAAGEVRPQISSATTCRVDMGRATVRSDDFPAGPTDGRGELDAGGRRWTFQHVSIGNPQCAVAVAGVQELESLDLSVLGPQFENDPRFPQRTNVSWFTALEPGRIRARIFERGVGETLSSGTGASGAAVAHRLAGGAAAVTVQLDGGELEVEIGEDLRVHLTGWAVPVYSATLSPELLEDLA
ncbi:MAG TPA: diaminopimelate epimerase [Solirubrobacteraceae bacterium]|nr:diaminopimelate epimerase [Solirubrobacteraceae bacterium]